MSIHTMLRSHPLDDGGIGRRPTIAPTRRKLDRRFPSLGFTIGTDQPWVELLVTTDPAQLDGARAASRTAATFYASRADGGLTPVSGGRARYVVPASVVDRLSATGQPLWYLAIAYPDATGSGGIPSSATGASGVVLVDPSLVGGAARGRRPRGLALSLAIPGGGLDPVDRLAGEDGADVGVGVTSGVTVPGATVPGATPPVASATGIAMGLRRRSLDTDDRLAGEDGADLPAGLRQTPSPVTPPAAPTPAPPAAPPAPAQVGPPAAPAAPPPAQVTTPAAAPTPAAPAPTPFPTPPPTPLPHDEYDDGWSSVETDRVPALSAVPALSDEYPDLAWGGVEDDRYGAVPAYQSLEDQPSGPVPGGDLTGAGASPTGASNGASNGAPNGVVPNGAAAPATDGVAGSARPTAMGTLPTINLDPEVQRQVIEHTVGRDGTAYAALNADGPFKGRHGPGHKAYQRFHTGLSYGIAEFNQDSGSLGQLLRLMQEREPDTFAAVFGEHTPELLAVLTAPGPSGEFVEGGRGPRVQPVDGMDVWDEPWASRFRAAGAVPAFRAAQNQLAAELYLAPMLTVAAGFGLTSERALCMVLDRAIALGEQGAKRWLADTVGPVTTHALRQSALAALGFDSVEAFQASVPGLLNDGEFGPVTHATLAAALRAMGAAAPVPVLDARQAVEAMARRGQGEDGAARLVRLATDPSLSDTPIGA